MGGDTRYLDLVERNEWENETWHFYVAYDADDLDYDTIFALMDAVGSGSDSWSIDDFEMSVEDVAHLVTYDDSGEYMRCHNDTGAFLTRDAATKWLRCESCRDKIHRWYKGNFCFRCACPTK